MKIFTALAALTLASTALVGCGESKPTAFNEIAAKVYCADLIKQQLRDPDSYRFNKAKVVSNIGEHDQYGKAYISFRSKNGFGGYVTGNATCTAFSQDGDLWHRAEIY